MLVVPARVYPWPAYINELISFITAYLLFIFLTKERTHKLVVILFIFSIYPFAQYFAGQIKNIDDAFIGFIYLNFISICIHLGYAFKKDERFIDCFILFLFFGCLLSAVIALLQWIDPFNNYFWINKIWDDRISANFGQPNHLGTISFLALIISMHLKSSGRISKFYYLFSIFLFCIVIVLTKSRTPIAQFLVTFSISLIFFRKDFFIIKSFLLIFLAYIISLIFVMWIDQEVGTINISTPYIRAGSTYRIDIYREFLKIALEKPFFGYGFNQIRLSMSENNYLLKLAVGGFNSTHNFLLDFFIFFGIVPFFLIVILAFHCLRIEVKNKNTVLMCFVIFTHALLELPHFYAHFLMIFFLFFGFNISQNDYKSNQLKYFLLPLLSIFFAIIFNFNYYSMMDEIYSLEKKSNSRKLNLIKNYHEKYLNQIRKN